MMLKYSSFQQVHFKRIYQRPTTDMTIPTNYFGFFILVLFLFTLPTNSCDDDSLYLIRSVGSGLVLDGRKSQVTVQYFDGHKPQLWTFKRGILPGLFIIINNSTGKVLDIETVSEDHIRVVLAEYQSKFLNQQWYIHYDARIVNAGLGNVSDILNANHVAGNFVFTNKFSTKTAQNFVIKERQACEP